MRSIYNHWALVCGLPMVNVGIEIVSEPTRVPASIAKTPMTAIRMTVVIVDSGICGPLDPKMMNRVSPQNIATPK